MRSGGEKSPLTTLIIFKGSDTMIMEIDQMIAHIRSFLSNSSDKAIVVGGVVGTEIERFVLEGVTEFHDFNKVLVVQCCQDYIGLMKEPMPNVKFLGDILIPTFMDDPLKPIDPFKPKYMNPDPIYSFEFNERLLANFDATVVLNAHLMDIFLAQELAKKTNGPIIFVVDPIESSWWSNRAFGVSDIPVITDTLLKVSPIIAMARYAIGVETRAINTKAKGIVNEINKMSKRSIGKIDDKQYVSSDIQLIDEIREKQLKAPFRKNQKLLVDSDIDVMVDDSNQRMTLMCGSMLVIHNAGSKPLMRMRLYNSKIIYATNVIYSKNFNKLISNKSDVRVTPGNILHICDFNKHRYNHTVYINSPYCKELSTRNRYSLLKNSNNLTIVNSYK